MTIPILLIHDVGAGGLSNAVPEAVDHSKHGARIELRDVDNAEPGMSPMGIWCNEAQERYVLIVSADRCEEFEVMCERERCPVYVIGTLTDDGRLVVNDREFDNRAVDMPMDMLLGNPPKMTRDVQREPAVEANLDLSGIELEDAVLRVIALSGGSRQVVPDSYWRQNSRWTQCARSARRTLAGARQRCCDYGNGFREQDR